MSVAEIEEGVFEATAIIDNGSFGTRTRSYPSEC